MVGTPPEEKSLVQILKSRSDTVFKGRSLTDEEGERFAETESVDVYQDDRGNYFRNPYDHVAVKHVSGGAVGILVADRDNKHCGVSHPHQDIPHLMGLYIREPYRDEGLGSELIHDFMQTVDVDRCMVDCLDRVKPFYEQLDCEVLYLQESK